MGMLAAVDAWVKRDHQAEWKMWESWLDTISRRVSKIDGVTTEVLQPEGLSNRSPRLRIAWDGAKLGITGQEVEKILLDTEPRIVLGGASGNRRQSLASSLTIMPYMMTPGDDKIAAERLYAVLSRPPQFPPLERPAPTVNLTGQWEARLEFVLGAATHSFVFEQQDSDLVGTHRGETLSSDLRGSVEGNQARFRSSHRYEGTRIAYEFTGTVTGDRMEGAVGLDEYGAARFTAQRHRYGAPGGVVRPVKNV